MSVFKVKLNNTNQGTLDRDPSSASAGDLGDQLSVSKQRTVYVMGPNKINRKLADGETFTDCNYWKRFAYPQVSLEEAFIEVVTDDGSVYSDVEAENVYPIVESIVATAGTTWTDNEFDIMTTHGGPALFTQIKGDSSQAVRVRLNGSTSAVFDLAAGSTQIFNAGDLSISKIEIDNTASGATDATIEVIVSVKSTCNS